MPETIWRKSPWHTLGRNEDTDRPCSDKLLDFERAGRNRSSADAVIIQAAPRLKRFGVGATQCLVPCGGRHEIIDDNLVPGKVRFPFTGCLGSDGGSIDSEPACFVKNGHNASGSGGPVVIVEAIYD